MRGPALIWRPKRDDVLCEVMPKRIEDSAVREIIEKVVESLRIAYDERDFVKRPLTTATEKTIKQILEEYLCSQLERIGETFEKELNIESKVNYEHATHAKFADIIKEIKEKLKSAQVDKKPQIGR